MAWTKQPKLVGSCGVGYETFNFIRDSLEQLRDDYLTEHSSGVNQQLPAGLHPIGAQGTIGYGYSDVKLVAPGRHNSPLIAIGVAHIAYDNGVDTTTPNIRWCSSEAVIGVQRIATGIHFIGVRGADTLMGRVTIRQTSNTAIYQKLCIPVVGGTFATSPTGLAVYLSANSGGGGAMALTDGIQYSVQIFRRIPVDYGEESF